MISVALHPNVKRIDITFWTGSFFFLEYLTDMFRTKKDYLIG